MPFEVNGIEKQENGISIVKICINRLLSDTTMNSAAAYLNFGKNMLCTKQGELKKLKEIQKNRGAESDEDSMQTKDSSKQREKSVRLNINYNKISS